MSASDVKKINKRNSIKIAFIADDIKVLNKFGLFHNATFGLMLACKKLKNVRIFLTQSNKLIVQNNKVYACFEEVVPIPSQDIKQYLKITSKQFLSLDYFDVLFTRKDPPVNQDYLSYLHILTVQLQRKKPFIINNPYGILKANEKLYALNFPDIIPPTLVTASKNEIFHFITQHKEVVIKPLFNKGGEGVSYLKNKDKKALKIVNDSLRKNHIVLLQKYIASITKGDKRIILLNGKPLGGIVRVPKKGEFRAHISRGAQYRKLKLSKYDLAICRKLKPYLQKDGIYFAGIDVIGKYLIEVNVTCPANLIEAGHCNKRLMAEEIIKWAIHASCK